jgi:anti-sigma factor RsiW
MRAEGSNGKRRPDPRDRDLWQRSQVSEATQDEAERLMDLAAYVDNRLDEEEAARVGALIARDPAAASDVAVARALAEAVPIVAESVVSRAAALVADASPLALVVAFPARPQPAPRLWHGAVGWSGLAAAVVLAGWLGFDLGSGLDQVSLGRADGASASEFLDSTPPLVRDFIEGWQT